MVSLQNCKYCYQTLLNFDPDDPKWFNRDRFVLSAGHESALLYTLLTLIGWLKIDDLQNFRQLHIFKRCWTKSSFDNYNTKYTSG